MAEPELAIKVTGVSKAFRLPHEKQSSIKGLFVNAFRRRRSYEIQNVLNDISFDVKKGEFFGIVGRNGSGKSTMLKILAGIYTPNKGKVEINGKLTPFIELGVGFSPELSGRENVYLNGALLGFSRKEMEAMYDEIVSFAELEQFMDQKLKNYSSGMQVRLAFSIAIRANTEILVLDEVLAVGDQAFQKKCLEYFAKIKNDKKTVILVTHDMGVAKRYCDRAILIEKGKITSQGNINTVVSDYQKINLDRAEKEIADRNDRIAKKDGGNTKQLTVHRIFTEDGKGKRRVVFNPNEKIRIGVELHTTVAVDNPSIGISFNNPGGPPVAVTSSSDRKVPLKLAANSTATLSWEVENIFNDGSYLISVTALDKSKQILLDQATEAYKFEVQGWPHPYGIVHPKDSLVKR